MLSARFAATAAIAFGSALASPHAALAWGGAAHRLVGEIASQSLPMEVPQFLRMVESARQIGEVSREPDRTLGAGEPHDSDVRAAQHIDLGDDLKIGRGPFLAMLPATREGYDNMLRAGGTNQYRAGYLPYAIMEAWQQVVTDLAYWRADIAGERYVQTPEQRTFFLKDQYSREGLIVRDIGYLSSLVAHAAEPLNVTVHSNGWGNFPNPQGFSSAEDLRSRFEAIFVRTRIEARDLQPRMVPYRDCQCAVARRISDYLLATQRQVIPLYQLEKSQGFEAEDGRGKNFVAARLAAAASELRDLIVDAWRKSADARVGVPAIPVADIESGRTNAYDALRGID